MSNKATLTQQINHVHQQTTELLPYIRGLSHDISRLLEYVDKTLADAGLELRIWHKVNEHFSIGWDQGLVMGDGSFGLGAMVNGKIVSRGYIQTDIQIAKALPDLLDAISKELSELADYIRDGITPHNHTEL